MSRAKKTIIIREARTYFRKYFECFHGRRPSTGLVQQNEKVVLVVAFQHHVTWCNINQSASACIRRRFCSDLRQDLLWESTTSQSLKSKVLHKARQTCGIEQIFFCFLIKMLSFLSHPWWNETCADGFSFPSRCVKLPVSVLESTWIIMSVRQWNILLLANVFKMETLPVTMTKKRWNASRTKTKQRSICAEGCHHYIFFHHIFFRLGPLSNIGFNISWARTSIHLFINFLFALKGELG